MPDRPTQEDVERFGLRETAARYRWVVEAAHDGICTTDAAGRLTYANPRLAAMLGRAVDECLGRPLFDFMDHAAALEARMRFARRQRDSPEIAELTLRGADGMPIVVLESATSRFDADGAFIGAVYLFTDVTARRRAEAALRESEERYAHISANVPGMVYQFAYRADGTNGYTFVSEGARTLFGIAPDAALRDPAALLDLIHPDDRVAFTALARNAAITLAPFRWEGRVILASGQERIVEVAARDERLFDGTVLSDGIVIDVTAQRELEEQLRQAQKMEAVGRLAGGIAHDFNNLLTVISGYSHLALAGLATDDGLGANLRQIEGAASRAAALTRQLLAFSRRQVLKARTVDANRAVAEVAAMLRRLIGEDITLRTMLAPELWLIYADPGQLEQVLMNLAVNARDAMASGGTLTLRTENRRIDASAARERPGLLAGDYAAILVDDTGTGIDPGVLPHIFEPFYTTKTPGSGTGLGLAMVYGIVKQSGGYVYVDSTVGKGSCFTIFLPRTSAEADDASTPNPAGVPRGSETILLVEDDTAVRSAVRVMLEQYGYSVVEAASADEALLVVARAEAEAVRIHLVLTDVVMPRQNGRALGERLAGQHRLEVLYMSGYTDDEILRRGLRQSGSAFLEKPFTPERLARAVRAAIDQATSGGQPRE